MNTGSPNAHFEVLNRSVFVRWQPVPFSTEPHQIGRLSSGDYEVLCQHGMLDEDVISRQVEYLIQKESEEKKAK